MQTFRSFASLALVGLIALGCIALGCDSKPASAPQNGNDPATISSAAKQTGTVTIAVDLEGTVTNHEVVDVAEGTTIEQLLRDNPDLGFEIKGSGLTAFVHQIGEQGTSGNEGWTYKVDDEFANEGIGSLKLTPPTTITWSYGSEFGE